MIKYLPEDFIYSKYGITARLVREDDAEFITTLRSNAKLGRFIHANDGDVEAQRQWTREYKKRERVGLDYYFIYFKDNEPIGLNRMYDIDWTHLSFTGGSWVSKPGVDPTIAMLPTVLISEIAFEILGLKLKIYEVRKGNKQVLSFHRNFIGAYEYGETELDCLFMVTKEIWENSKLKKLVEREYE